MPKLRNRRQIIILDSYEDVFAKYKKYPDPMILLREDATSIWVDNYGVQIQIPKKEIKAMHSVGLEK